MLPAPAAPPQRFSPCAPGEPAASCLWGIRRAQEDFQQFDLKNQNLLEHSPNELVWPGLKK